MGTRGLLFVRCRGRYFAYYNHWDSYPEGLGDEIVQQIPEDPEKYREWLQMMRERFSKLAQLYEEICLPIDGQKHTLEELSATSFLAIDDRLQEPPHQTRITPIDRLWMEWTYTIDLDRELFGVDNSVYYKMSKIPRDDHWITCLKTDKEGRRILSDHTPMEVIGSVNWVPEVRDASKDSPENINIQSVDTSILAPAGLESFFPRIAALSDIFVFAHHDYWGLLAEFLFEWKQEDFCFRETAFSLLSLAAGEVSFECPDCLDRNHESEGYFLIPDDKLQKEQHPLLPGLLSEYHAPGVEPGSAPHSTSYWLGNVLVYLAARIDLTVIEEASIAEAVDTGLGQGLASFYAVVFSIMDFILIHVDTSEDGLVKVQRSPLLNLFYFDGTTGFVNGARSRSTFDKPCSHRSSRSESPVISVHDSDSERQEVEEDPEQDNSEGLEDPDHLSYEESDEDDNLGATDQQRVSQQTFKLLVQFFNNAAVSHLLGKDSQTLPNEILGSIMRFANMATSKAMAKASSYCGKLDLEKLHLNDDYAIVDIDDKSGPRGYILADLHTGERIPAKIGWQNGHFKKGSGMALSPIVGFGDRRSIVAFVNFHLTNAPLKSKTCVEKLEMPEKEAFHSSSAYRNPGVEERIFNMPKHIYPGGIEVAWGEYITHLIKKGKDSMYDFIMVSRAQWPCLLPPGYRELRMEHWDCNGLHIFIRHPNDESAQEWGKTVKHAVTELFRTETYNARSRAMGCGRPVIIAFGSRVKFFYYVHRFEETPTLSSTASPCNLEIAARCVESDPSRRLVQLIPGDDPIDIRQSEDRLKLETWITIFSGSNGTRTEWDPFTGDRRPYGTTKQEGGAAVQDEGQGGSNDDVEDEVEDEDEGNNNQTTTT